ncbi:hypothetical protein HU200_014835 [Digitaria exilis]|uniref:Uncharacterized protein n=1 Tax=Digitaria exilis TaxID=1010633 RepID=A0A835FBQ5_9POAL|nr:hypothetical protein HU200_014835 [Digitaria exilis]
MFYGSFPEWMDIHEEGNYTLTLNHAHTYMHLTTSGIIRFAKQWDCDSVLWSAPEIACGVYAYCGACDYDSFCGPYGLCTSSHSCTCPIGFDPPSIGVSNGVGCTRELPLSCESGSTEPEATFYPIDGILRYPRDAWPSKAKSMTDCESSCLRDCTCTAFAYNSTCLLWFWELRNTVVLESGSYGNRMYIRTASKQQQSSFRTNVFFPHKRVVVLWVIGVFALILIGFILLRRCRRKLFEERMMHGNGSLKIFSFAQMNKVTKNFSQKLGEGGFGCVFKGTMPVSTAVAVKRLKSMVQEDKQFRAEVQTIGMIQHANLVCLLGFWLSWEVRYRVALGTARGLAYLHEECKDCIVHCDIKPDNILLNDNFCPKIADFGMAKLLGRDFSRVLTTMRGTIGYLAPEWISGVPIAHKADVYSYGMMLLEIISGRRNSEKIKEGKFTYFPIYAAVKVNEGDVMCLLDGSLEGNADAEQLMRACRVACWCIQDAEDHRPMMGQVVHMLEGVVDVKVPPVPRSLQNYVGMEDSISADLKISEVSY